MLHPNFCLTICLALVLTSPHGFTKEPPQDKLPLGSILDDKGRPLSHSNKPHTDLQFSSPKTTRYRSSTQLKSNSKKLKAKSRKQQLASRSSVANNPSCRWLHNRMTSLERQLQQGVNVRNLHYQQELTARQGEWECMKCGAEGPAQADHANCQYRR